MLQTCTRPRAMAARVTLAAIACLEWRCIHAPREAIEQAVVQVFGVGQEDLRCMSRGRANVALARQVAMYLAHVVCGMTLTDTGRLFGRDRTTVAHACSVI